MYKRQLENNQLLRLLAICLAAVAIILPLYASQASASLGDNMAGLPAEPVVSDAAALLPDFKLPYCSKSQTPDCVNESVYWTGGPHGYQQSADFTGQYPADQGSGLDFAGDPAYFDVLAMAAGTVVEATCDGYGPLGCLVAIQHDVGDSILIYAQLEPHSMNHVAERFWQYQALGLALHAPQGVVLGKAGRSGGQEQAHLHLELRDGSASCHSQCLPGDLGGNPVGWDASQALLDGYRIYGYPVDGGADYYNYEGSAVVGASQVLPAFPFKDQPGDLQRQASVTVGAGFVCSSATDCEDNGQSPATQFAGHGIIAGSAQPAGLLISTNIPQWGFEPPQPALDAADFLADVTLQPGIALSPGQTFTKTWRLKNTGDTTWDDAYQLAFIAGQAMNGPATMALPPTPPGQEVDISVTLAAPLDKGDYAGYWRLHNALGTYFGPPLTAGITVSGDPSTAEDGGYELACIFNCPAVVPPGYTFRPVIRATVGYRLLLEPRGDGLRNVDGNLFGVMPQQVVQETIWPGQSYDFTFADGNPFTAPDQDGFYETVWRLWQDGDWVGPELRLQFEVRADVASANHRPNRPDPVSPSNWTAYFSQNTTTLCAQANGDQDGDAIVDYQFDIHDSDATWNSGWLGSDCAATSALPPYGYLWRVKVRDARGAESDWSEGWRFTVVNPALSITSLTFQHLDVDRESVRVKACTAASAAVDITMRVLVNEASDGSSAGAWRLTDEQAVRCQSDLDAPIWNTLDFAGGLHRVRAEAYGLHATWDGTAAREEIYAVRTNHRPNEPTGQLPPDGAFLNTQTVPFQWRETLRTTNYRIQAGPNSDFSDPLLDRVFLQGTMAYTYTFPSGYETIFWRVNAGGPYGVNDSHQQFHIDLEPPTASAAALTPITASTTFTVSWSGSDTLSGVRWYHVQFRDSSHPEAEWADWLVNTGGQSGSFSGQAGHAYAFRARAMDQAGNWGAWSVEAETLVDLTAALPDSRSDSSPQATVGPDLVFVDLAAFTKPDGELLLRGIVHNQGDQETINGFFSDLYLDHLPAGPGDLEGSIRFWVNKPIAPGAAITLTTLLSDLSVSQAALPLLGDVTETAGVLYAQTDSTDVVAEPDDANNIYGRGLDVCLTAPDGYEEDGDSLSATPLLAYQGQEHNLHPAGDEDWFVLQLEAGQEYTIKTRLLGQKTDTILSLYDTDGATLLQVNDDHGGELSSLITFTPPVTGDYYVRVNHWSPIASGCGNGYAILVYMPSFHYLPAILIQNMPPFVPYDPTPADGATGVDRNANLGWKGGDPTGDAVRYDVYFEANDGSPDVLLCANIAERSCDPGQLAYDTTYYWYVVARDQHGATATGPVWTFKTQKEPAPPPACSNLIVNGGFEGSGGWTIGLNRYPAAYSTVRAHSGGRSMRIGITNPYDNRYAYSSIWQFVAIPAGASKAQLNFWLYPMSSEWRVSPQLAPAAFIPTSAEEGTQTGDTQYVLLYDQGGQQHIILYQRNNSQAWQGYSVDLRPFAGQTVKLYFGVFNDGYGGITSMYADDVSLEVCR